VELDPEIHAHGHKVGHHWIDIALALSALILSICSMTIAIRNETEMKRLVTANSWPYIELQHGNARDGERILHFDARNAGIGPATLEKLVVTYRDRPVHSAQELLAMCCQVKPDDSVTLELNGIEGRVFAARELVTFLAFPKVSTNEPYWDRLDDERFNVDMAACYGSVFDDHWITRLTTPKPVKVSSCDELQGDAFQPNPYAAKKPQAATAP
jgi:hypothetical protein